jgi:hypothetical protein
MWMYDLGSAGLPSHMPGMTDAIFDSRAVRLHRDRAAGRVERVRPILAEVADRLLDRLDDTTRRRGRDAGGRRGSRKWHRSLPACATAILRCQGHTSIWTRHAAGA